MYVVIGKAFLAILGEVMRTTVDLIDHSPALPLNVDLPNRV